MKQIDMLVIGNSQDYERLRTDIDKKAGVVFAHVNNISRSHRSQDANQTYSNPPIELISNAIAGYRPKRAIFLSPYQTIRKDLLRLSDHGVDIRLCGPLPFRAHENDLPITEIYQSDLGLRAMLEASRDADFGEPVYLRMISCPDGGKWNKWWCAFQSCRLATKMLNAPLQRIYVAAVGSTTRLHISITLTTVNKSTGHLLVANHGSMLHGDLFLVGTGGTLTSDSLLNNPGMYKNTDYRMVTRPGAQCLDGLWQETSLIELTRDERRFYDQLLRAIGETAKWGKGVCLNYPMS